MAKWSHCKNLINSVPHRVLAEERRRRRIHCACFKGSIISLPEKSTHHKVQFVCRAPGNKQRQTVLCTLSPPFLNEVQKWVSEQRGNHFTHRFSRNGSANTSHTGSVEMGQPTLHTQVQQKWVSQHFTYRFSRNGSANTSHTSSAEMGQPTLHIQVQQKWVSQQRGTHFTHRFSS